jgi:hypothetical protein
MLAVLFLFARAAPEAKWTLIRAAVEVLFLDISESGGETV